MKKILALATLFAAVFTLSASAQQGGGDPAAMKQRMKERFKPQLIEKTKLSDEKADKVIDIYAEAQPQRREIRNDQSLSDEDKAKKMAAIEVDLAKKYKAVPLTDDELKAVNSFFEEMRKNRGGNGGGGNGGGGNKN